MDDRTGMCEVELGDRLWDRKNEVTFLVDDISLTRIGGGPATGQVLCGILDDRDTIYLVHDGISPDEARRKYYVGQYGDQSRPVWIMPRA
jgi:hypothetical protein